MATKKYTDEDLETLAPAAYESIKGYQDAWQKAYDAGDQDAMDAAHSSAEKIRSDWGYSTDGDSSAGGGDNGFSYENAPSYTNKYTDQISELTDSILGRGAFSYDYESDPLYQMYAKQYTTNGQRAMQDTIGQVSARTGGLASSYAGSAGQQSYNNYMQELSDKIPELQQLAYSMYQDEGDTQRANLEMLNALETGDYNKYLDLLSQYNTDRNFSYGEYSDDRSYDYQTGRDAVEDSRYDKEQAYSTSQDTKTDAQNRIDTFFAEGGTAADLDPALVEAAGYTPAELAAAEKYYADQAAAAVTTSSGSIGSGSGSGSGNQDYAGLFAAAEASGTPKSFIANNYKAYGFTSNTGLYDDYQEGIDNPEGSLSSSAKSLKNTFDLGKKDRRGNSTGDYSSAEIEEAILNSFGSGIITEDDFTSLMDIYGLDWTKYAE